ncbi:MAG: alpha amylase C-terminal domain-containing protein, partial [bacterium]
VHSKGTILDKMWGNNDQKFAQAKSLYTYMMTHPGKKLNFMGNELAEYKEWDESKALGWNILQYPQHDSFSRFFGDLNKVVAAHKALWQYDYYNDGFQWLVVDDHQQSVFAYARFAPDGDCIVAIMNFIGNSHKAYKLPVPFNGAYQEIINTDQDIYTGSNYVNGTLHSQKGRTIDEDQFIEVKLAPFSSCIFAYQGKETLVTKRAAKQKAAALKEIEKAEKELADAKAKLNEATKILKKAGLE